MATLPTDSRLMVGTDLVDLTTTFSLSDGDDFLLHHNGGEENIYVTEQATTPTKAEGRMTLNPGGYLLLEVAAETFYAYTDQGQGFVSGSVQR